MRNSISDLTDAVLRLAEAVDSITYHLSKRPVEQGSVEPWVHRPKLDRVRGSLLAELAKTYCVRGVPKPWHYISHVLRGSASQARRQAFAALAVEGLVMHDNVRCWLSPAGERLVASSSPPSGPGPSDPKTHGGQQGQAQLPAAS